MFTQLNTLNKCINATIIAYLTNKAYDAKIKRLIQHNVQKNRIPYIFSYIFSITSVADTTRKLATTNRSHIIIHHSRLTV